MTSARKTTPELLKRRWKEGAGPQVLKSLDALLEEHAVSEVPIATEEVVSLLAAIPFVDEVHGGRDLRGALIRQMFFDMDLSGFDFSHARIEPGFLRCKLQAARLDSCILRGRMAADFTEASFRSADLRAVSFVDAVGLHAVFDGAKLDRCVFINANLTGSSLRNASCRSADFTDARLVGCDMSGAVLSGVILRNAELYGAKGVNV